jgi:hypothetical protein
MLIQYFKMIFKICHDYFVICTYCGSGVSVMYNTALFFRFFSVLIMSIVSAMVPNVCISNYYYYF